MALRESEHLFDDPLGFLPQSAFFHLFSTLDYRNSAMPIDLVILRKESNVHDKLRETSLHLGLGFISLLSLLMHKDSDLSKQQSAQRRQLTSFDLLHAGP